MNNSILRLQARRHLRLVLIAGLAFCGAGLGLAGGPAPTQGQKPVPMVGERFSFTPGSWGQYRIRAKATNEEYQVAFAVLEEVRQRKGRAFWLEVETEVSGQPAVVTRLLMPETDQGPGDALDAIVQIAGYRPFQVPRGYLKPDPKGGQEQVGELVSYLQAESSEPKPTPWKGRTLNASTVKATDSQGRPVAILVSEEAPPLCILSLDAPDATMELLDWGTGAKTRITGKPVGLWRWVFGLIVQGGRTGQAPEPTSP